MRNRMLLMALAAVIVVTPVWAFHDEGVAHCNGCHTMHNSYDGAPMNEDLMGNPGGTPVGTGWNRLLIAPTPTDTCLSCHEGTNNSYDVWADDVLVPNKENGAGDFVFLEEDNLNDGHGGSDPANFVPGYAGGHTVVSARKNMPADPVLLTSPGGNYPSSDLGCTSCHDPHGTQAFRILYQAGQTTISETGTVIDWDSTLMATPISLFGPGETNTNHNAYNGGYSSWCAECHGDFHQNSGVNIHPSGENLSPEVVANYNAYSGSTDCVGVTAPCGNATPGDSYLAMVPFQDPDITDTSSMQGPDTTNSRVVCVTCHRAHASSAENAGRWDFDITGLAEDGAESGSYALPNPYDEFQRSLCNKCHAQDELDMAVDFTP